MTQQDRHNAITSINADVMRFAQRLQAAQPTMHQLAENLHKASQQIAPLLPSIASAGQGLRAWEAALKNAEHSRPS